MILIKQVAGECGLPDPFHFPRVFTSVFGSSPPAFRRLRECARDKNIQLLGTPSKEGSKESGFGLKRGADLLRFANSHVWFEHFFSIQSLNQYDKRRIVFREFHENTLSQSNGTESSLGNDSYAKKCENLISWRSRYVCRLHSSCGLPAASGRGVGSRYQCSGAGRLPTFNFESTRPGLPAG
jgi:hypothetical protein